MRAVVSCMCLCCSRGAPMGAPKAAGNVCGGGMHRAFGGLRRSCEEQAATGGNGGCTVQCVDRSL